MNVFCYSVCTHVRGEYATKYNETERPVYENLCDNNDDVRARTSAV